MKFFETSKHHSFKKSTYLSLRWIGISGQLISINFVYFFLNFKFDFFNSNLIILFGILSNLYLSFIYKKTQLSDRSAFIFLVIDILQLGFLLYLTGGVNNPFVIFLIIPSVFSSSNLSFKTNLLLVFLTTIVIIFLTFFSEDLPGPISDHFHISPYYHYSIPVSLIIALLFLNYFAMIFGMQSRLRKEALTKMEQVMAKEHELLSLGGQAAAAAHSLGTPLSTIKIITQDLLKQFKGKEDIGPDIELLASQVERCNNILKRLSLNPMEEDEFIDKDISMKDY
ncbi:sensor histidine kinase, partial [Candidatus Pelagibacter sp.]|nr:sensor histidine kinase [Candidatus Pelagibacter sp.]